MKHGSLFSGIGGFDLAAEWMGWENVFHCECNKFGQQVLKYYWPKAISYDDITKTDFTIHRGKIDLLTGGFPCQPYSSAGKRKGKEDERHLWPQMLRAIKEIQPSWIVGENVYGLVNWSGGLVFHEVQADLEAEGYEVFPFLLPAAGVNAPHRRDRIWFVAYCNSRRLEGATTFGRDRINAKWESEFGIVANTNHNGLNECNSGDEINTSKGGVNAFGNFDKSDGDGDAANTLCKGLEWSKERRGFGEIREESHQFSTGCVRSKWEKFPTVPPICSRDDGLSDRLDSITFSKWRNESIKAGGNAIVPQVVYQIFKTIEQYKKNEDHF